MAVAARDRVLETLLRSVNAPRPFHPRGNIPVQAGRTLTRHDRGYARNFFMVGPGKIGCRIAPSAPARIPATIGPRRSGKPVKPLHGVGLSVCALALSNHGRSLPFIFSRAAKSDPELLVLVCSRCRRKFCGHPGLARRRQSQISPPLLALDFVPLPRGRRTAMAAPCLALQRAFLSLLCFSRLRGAETGIANLSVRRN